MVTIRHLCLVVFEVDFGTSCHSNYRYIYVTSCGRYGRLHSTTRASVYSNHTNPVYTFRVSDTIAFSTTFDSGASSSGRDVTRRSYTTQPVSFLRPIPIISTISGSYFPYMYLHPSHPLLPKYQNTLFTVSVRHEISIIDILTKSYPVILSVAASLVLYCNSTCTVTLQTRGNVIYIRGIFQTISPAVEC